MHLSLSHSVTKIALDKVYQSTCIVVGRWTSEEYQNYAMNIDNPLSLVIGSFIPFALIFGFNGAILATVIRVGRKALGTVS